MSRFTQEEIQGLHDIRDKLQQELSQQAPFPEVVGDRRLLRFFHGNGKNIAKTVECYGKFLNWRRENNIDKIRHDIVYGKAVSPMNFPSGQKIIALAPQLVFTAKAVDKRKQPLYIESYDFDLKELLAKITLDEYIEFLIYSLEYRSLCLEQVSEMYERQYLLDNPDPATRMTPYRFIVRVCSIKDLTGVNLGQLGHDGRSILGAIVKLVPYYPEMLGVSYNVNVPWIFNAFWFFAKGLLDPEVIKKFKMSSDCLKPLLEDLTIENIPVTLGGQFKLDYDEHFPFDLSENGPLWYEGAPKSIQREIVNPENNKNILTSNSLILSTPVKMQDRDTSTKVFITDPIDVDSNKQPKPLNGHSNGFIKDLTKDRMMKPLKTSSPKKSYWKITWNFILNYGVTVTALLGLLIYVSIYSIDKLSWFVFPFLISVVFSLQLYI